MISNDVRQAKPSMTQIMGHALHPILAAFPIVLYAISTGCYIAYAINLQSFWFKAAFYAGCAGVFAFIAAAIPGILDYLSHISAKSAARKTARTHVAFNILALMLFVTNTLLLWNVVTPEVLRVEAFDALDHRTPMWVAIIGMISTLTAAYQGGKLVQQYGIGTDEPPLQSRRSSPIHPRITTT